MISREDRLLGLIGGVYDAALDPELWFGIAPKIAAALDAPSTSLLTRPIDGKLTFLSGTGNFTARLGQDYEAYYHERDVRARRATELGLSRAYLGEELVLDADFARTEYYQDWYRKAGVFHGVSSVLAVSSDEIAICGVHRSRSARRFDQEDKNFFERFLPHLRRALQLRRRLRSANMAENIARDALERTALATLVTNRDGAILHSNHEAERLLRQSDAIRAVNGRLAASTRAASERLAMLIRGASDAAGGRSHDSGGALSIPRGERLPLTALVAPLRPARGGLRMPVPAAILFVRDPEAPDLAGDRLQSLFGLTRAEAAIASALAEGKALDDIATGFRISLNTARTHLKTIFVKTNTSRQAQLIATMLRSVATLSGDRP